MILRRGLDAIALIHLFHRVRIRFRARFMIQLFVGGVERTERRNVIVLPRSRRFQLPRFFQFLRPALHRRRIRLIPKLVPQAHRHAPVRHRALRVLLLRLCKRLLRLLVPERMQQRHASLKSFLRLGRAGNREMHRAQLLLAKLVVMTFVGKGHKAERRHKYKCQNATRQTRPSRTPQPH